MKQKILIVEDEPEIVKLIVNRLDSGHYDISIEYDGEKAYTITF
jgi:DNA-binding response OmpR family regulator